jgi:hypothetical protein
MANSMRDYGPARKSIYSSHFTYLSVRKSRAEQDWGKPAVAPGDHRGTLFWRGTP